MLYISSLLSALSMSLSMAPSPRGERQDQLLTVCHPLASGDPVPCLWWWDLHVSQTGESDLITRQPQFLY